MIVDIAESGIKALGNYQLHNNHSAIFIVISKNTEHLKIVIYSHKLHSLQFCTFQ